MAPEQKKIDVTLEEALSITGTGRYTMYVLLTVSLILFGGMLNIQGMSIILPVAGCDLHLTSSEKGTLTSITFAGMLLSGPFSGILSDAFGRVRISFMGQFFSVLLMLLNSFAPNTTSLMTINFINGFMLTGAITPVYVLVSEFCPIHFRARALILCSTIATLSNMYLPGMALLIMPLNIEIPIFKILTFSSWRLFLLLSTIPNLVALILLWRLPETPKFLLIQGHKERTLEVLKNMYAVNHKKREDEYPVLNVILDSIDRDYVGLKDDSSLVWRTVKQMISGMTLLFNRKYIIYTIMSCVLLFTQIGTYNIYILWLPEQLSRMNQYIEINGVYDETLCNMMMSTVNSGENVDDCVLKYDFFSYGIILGILQFSLGLLVSFFADRIGKKVILVGCLYLASAMSFSLIFSNLQYLIIAALISVAIMTSVSFPIIMTFIMDFYPTYVRSTASAVTMIFGRLGASGGNQIMGLLYDNHCDKAFYGITAFLAATATMCLFIRTKKNC
ncbi:synaptic vesicle 2-related protein [Halyomorpha halys]|uniref:synaptic vesicle 2-related protein n=1 Tax=Halyomorpha halys TaxID=286706 RepID=UPI0006D50748|nr:synaptic vesicle 2-related protein-like [Halyomorpha halys]